MEDMLMRTRSQATVYRSQLTILVFFFWVAGGRIYPFSLVLSSNINRETDRRWTWLRMGTGARDVIAHGISVAVSFDPGRCLSYESHYDKIFVHV